MKKRGCFVFGTLLKKNKLKVNRKNDSTVLRLVKKSRKENSELSLKLPFRDAVQTDRRRDRQTVHGQRDTQTD